MMVYVAPGQNAKNGNAVGRESGSMLRRNSKREQKERLVKARMGATRAEFTHKDSRAVSA